MEFEAWKLVVGALSLGGAWGGAKAALNGTRERVKKLEAGHDNNARRINGISESLVRIETKQDILIKQMEK